MVGYSRHMQADEAATLRALREARSVVIEPAVTRHGGAVFKTTGDGLLAEFSSSVSATQCGVDIQRELPATDSAVPGQFRIGVSLGEIVVDGDDRYGDGVNLAARLEAVASPGGVSVSRLVRDQTEGKLAARFVSRGALALKNMAEPVEVFDVVPADAVGAPARTVRPRRPPRLVLAALAAVAVVAVAGIAAFLALPRVSVPGVVQSTAPLIAVLPFANQSGDPGEEYFSDGITDDVIGALGRFSSLAVLSRNAVMPFKGRQAASDEVVQKLGARYVVEGSARRAGDRVRVQARLTDAQGARVLWSDRFDASTRDLFVLQDELVQQIAGSLASQVDRMERERARRKPTENLDAYDLVLRGRALLVVSSRAAHVQARALFERAMTSDPTFADARVGLARVLYFYVQYGFTESPVETAQEAEAHLREALRLDPANVRALGLLGQVLTYFGRYDDALASIDRALAINPSDAEAYYSRASVLLWVGRLEEAGRATDLARRLDPATALRPDQLFNESLRLILLGEPEQARALIERHAGSAPSFSSLYVLLAIAYAQLDRPDDAARVVETVRKTNPFFDAEQFGTRLREASQRRIVIEGLRKAGLRPG